MTRPSLYPQVSAGELEAQVTESGETFQVRLAGSADMRSQPILEQFVTTLHARAIGKVQLVTVDLRELEFMNSSCFKALVTWLSTLQDLAPGERYRIHFVSNASFHWQRRSLNALKCFGGDLVTVES